MLRVEQKWPSGVKSSGKAGERGQRALLATSLFTTAKMTLSLALRRWLVGRRAGPFVWHRCRSGGVCVDKKSLHFTSVEHNLYLQGFVPIVLCSTSDVMFARSY